MKKIFIVLFVCFAFTTVEAKKCAFVEIGHSNMSVLITNVTDIPNKVADHPKLIQHAISIGKSLSRETKTISSSAIAEINDALAEAMADAKAEGVAELDIFVFFSSSYDYLDEGEKLRVSTKIKAETGIVAEFVTSYDEGKAITETALRELRETGTVVYIGSSTTKGGTIDRNPQNGRMRFQSFDMEYGVRKLKDKMLLDKPVDQENYLATKHTEIRALFDEAISSKPVIKQRVTLILCGDAPYYISTLLGKDAITPSDLIGLKQKIKNPGYLKSKGVAENIDEVFMLTAIHFVQTVIEAYGISDVRADNDERSFALGLGLTRLKQRE